MIYSGDTVRLKVNFKTFTGEAINPDNVTLTIYDIERNQIEQYELDDTYRQDVGVYFFDYITPDDEQEIIYEFKGVYNNYPIIVRDSLKINFK